MAKEQKAAALKAPLPLMDKVGVYFYDGSKTCIVTGFSKTKILAVVYDAKLNVAVREFDRDLQLRPVLQTGLPYPIVKAAGRMRAAKVVSAPALVLLQALIGGETNTEAVQ